MLNAKAKGSDFERRVAKLFTTWSGHEFHRTPGSGSLHWANNNSVTGDLVAPPELNFPVSVEAKKHECDYCFMRIMVGSSEIWEFWKQACEDAARVAKKTPWLVFAKNRKPIYVMMTLESYNFLADLNSEFKSLDNLHISKGENNTVIMEFEKVLEKVSLEEVLKLQEIL